MINLHIVLKHLLSYIVQLFSSFKIKNTVSYETNSVDLETSIEHFLGIERKNNAYEPKTSIDESRNGIIPNINDSICDNHVTKMYHCRQLESWDCGIACIFMILRWIRSPSKDEFDQKRNSFYSSSSKGFKYGHSENISKEEMTERKWMLNETKTRSIWSIDLAILFHKIMNFKKTNHPVNHCNTKNSNKNEIYSMLFCSVHLGVNPSYSNFSYYQRAFAKDKFRVNERFQVARNLKIPMSRIISVVNKHCHLSLERIISIISKKDCVAIALIDNNILLHPSVTQEQPINLSQGSDTISPLNENIVEGKDKNISSQEVSYTGHYIILCGISTESQDVEQAMTNLYGNQNEKSPILFNKHLNSESNISPSSYCLVIKNPGVVDAVDFLMPSHFESAWQANGTDQDILFFHKHN